MASEVDLVGDITDDYLRAIYTDAYPDMISLTTSLNGTQFNLNAPYQIRYFSQIEFPAEATSFPSQDELDTVLANSFDLPQVQAYLGLLTALPDTNIFSTTSNVTSDISTVLSSPKNSAWITLTAVSGATVFVFLIGGIVYKRNNYSSTRSISDEEFNNLINGRKGNQMKIMSTVAGDTAEGSATVWSGSRTAATRIVEENPYLEEEGYSLNGSEWMTRDGQPSASNSIHDFGEHRLDDDDINAIGTLLETNRLETERNLMSANDDLMAANDDIEGSKSIFNYDDEQKHLSTQGLDLSSRDADHILNTIEKSTPMNNNKSTGLDNFSDDSSEDEVVPLRVVDLIKRFSPNF